MSSWVVFYISARNKKQAAVFVWSLFVSKCGVTATGQNMQGIKQLTNHYFVLQENAQPNGGL